MRELTADWEYDAVGGLTLGADPVATAIMHASEGLDAFVVRKAEKAHGLQQRIEGPSVAGRRVLAVEDTSTTGESLLTAVEALAREAPTVVGVAVIVDRGGNAAIGRPASSTARPIPSPTSVCRERPPGATPI